MTALIPCFSIAVILQITSVGLKLFILPQLDHGYLTALRDEFTSLYFIMVNQQNTLGMTLSLILTQKASLFGFIISLLLPNPFCLTQIAFSN